MKVFVVLANPKERCFTRDVCAIFIEEVSARGHEVVLRDLYAMGFDPVATERDIRGNIKGNVAPDVAAEQKLVLWADVIAFIHPVWWIDRPAILKGYIDRVFALGFAYGYGKDGERGTLAGKKGVIITSAGSTMEHFVTSGKLSAIRTAQDVGTMEFCDIEMIGHLHFGPVGRRSTHQMIEQYKDEVRQFVADHF
jgi:NAD(P)H dehydrogenase (quinone)